MHLLKLQHIFTHLHRMSVRELESNMDYVEHRPFPHYLGFDYVTEGLAIVLVA